MMILILCHQKSANNLHKQTSLFHGNEGKHCIGTERPYTIKHKQVMGLIAKGEAEQKLSTHHLLSNSCDVSENFWGKTEKLFQLTFIHTGGKQCRLSLCFSYL
jgi:hypothetical protein